MPHSATASHIDREGALQTLKEIRTVSAPQRHYMSAAFLPALRGALTGAGLTRIASPRLHSALGPLLSVAPFTTTSPLPVKQMPSRPEPPPESEIEEAFLRGSGPGGQKINKTSSAVQLKHLPTGIVVKSQATRSRAQNRKIARELLATRLDELVNGDRSRTAIVGSFKKKRSDSAAKKSRRKYRKLEEEKAEKAVDETAEGAEATEKTTEST